MYITWPEGLRRPELTEDTESSEGGQKWFRIVSRSGPCYWGWTRSYKFRVVHRFTYLGSEVNCNKDLIAEIQKRILSANRCFYGFIKHLRCHLTSRNTKTYPVCKQMFLWIQKASEVWLDFKEHKNITEKILTWPVITYASEIWT